MRLSGWYCISILWVGSIFADSECPVDVAHCPVALPIPTDSHVDYKKLTLREAIYITLERNQLVNSNELSMTVAKNGVANAYFNFEPQIFINGSASYQNGVGPAYNLYTEVNLNTPIGTSLSFQYTPNFLGPYLSTAAGAGTVTLTQPLLKGFGLAFNLAGLNNSFASFNIAAQNFKLQMMQLINTTIVNYYNYIQAQWTMAEAKVSYEQSVRQADSTNKQVQAGQLPSSELVQVQVGVATIKVQYLQTVSATEQAKKTLLQGLGLPLSTNIEADPSIPRQFPSFPDYKPLFKKALEGNIGYLTQISSIVSTKNGVIVAQNGRKWTLDLTASFNVIGPAGVFSANSPAAAPAAVPAVGLQLLIPIGNVSLKTAWINSEVSLASQEINLAFTRRTLETTIKSAVISLNLLHDQILLSQQQVALTRDSVRSAEIKLAYGQLAALEMTTYRDQLLNAEISLAQTEIQYIQQYAQLEINIGQLLEDYGIKLKY